MRNLFKIADIFVSIVEFAKLCNSKMQEEIVVVIGEMGSPINLTPNKGIISQVDQRGAKDLQSCVILRMEFGPM